MSAVEWKKLGDVVNLSRGVVISKDYLRDNEGIYPVYSSQTANDGVLGRISTYNYDGEFLTWTTDGANAGTVFHRFGKFSITNVCGLIKIKDEAIITYRYLYYWLNLVAKNYVSVGMGNPKLMSNAMGNIVIPLIPIAKQQEIVSHLDTFTSLISNLESELDMRRKQYEHYRNQLLDFEGVEMNLQDFCILKAGKSIKAEEIATEKDLQNRHPCYGGNGIRGYVPYKSHEGEYPIIGRQGALCGCVNWATGEFYATEHAIVVKGKENVEQRFLFILFQNADLNQYKTQGAQPGLSVAKLNELYFSIPSLETQRQIVEKLDTFEQLIQSLETEIKLRKQQYEYYREKLLTFE